MTVNTLELRTRIAPVALSQELIDKGLKVTRAEADSYRFTVHWDPVDTPRLADAAATFLLQDWLYGFIEQRTTAMYSFLDEEEREYVALLTFHALRKQRDGQAQRVRQGERDGQCTGTPAVLQSLSTTISDAVDESLRRQQPLSLDALARFRLRDSLKGVEKAVEMVVDQFLSDREYEEFVAMLRYMLDQQPKRAQVLHLFCSDEQVWICNAEGDLVRDEEVSTAASAATEGEEVNAEDLAMSILITRSPCRIVIHDMTHAAPWPSFSETVERVFLERTERCENCSTCSKLQSVGLPLQRSDTAFESSVEASIETSLDAIVPESTKRLHP